MVPPWRRCCVPRRWFLGGACDRWQRDGDQATVGVVLHQLGLASGVRFADRVAPRIKANLRERANWQNCIERYYVVTPQAQGSRQR